MILRRGFLAALPLLFLAVQARALRISVAGLARPVDGQLQLDIGAFENLISDLAELLLPSGSAIAQSPGPLGLELGTTLSLGLIDSADPAWSEGARAAGGTQGLFELSMRKGLPASLDIGARMTHILGSEIWGFVMELGAAPLDGLDGLPDLALHAQVGGTVGRAQPAPGWFSRHDLQEPRGGWPRTHQPLRRLPPHPRPGQRERGGRA